MNQRPAGRHDHEDVLDLREPSDVNETTAASEETAARTDGALAGRELAVERREEAVARREADVDRARAGERVAAARDRRASAADRVAAAADRAAAAKDREAAAFDDLTGALSRGPGFVELQHEISRARRTAQPLVLAFVDVVGLKAINDSGGHARGDDVLRQVADTLRARLRTYDPIVRYGGDEFVCALSGLTIAQAHERFASVDAALAQGTDRIAVTTGIAELGADDSLEDLVRRADADLYRRRHEERSSPS